MIDGPTPATLNTVVLTADEQFASTIQAAASADSTFSATVLSHHAFCARPDALQLSPAVVVVDLDGIRDESFIRQIAERIQGMGPVIGVTTTLNDQFARALLQMRASDFFIKSGAAEHLVDACTRALKTPDSRVLRSKVFTLLPAAGGVGVTTLAIQTALILLRSRGRNSESVCLVDLNFQQGACADYLDIEPRLDLDEIEPRPERLDAQLLEVMLSHHSSGLKLIVAPQRPTEMRSFDPQIVVRLLELVSSRFDYVVLDLPRTWFSWTDNILLGSDRAFIITEATVPGLKSASGLCSAISERLGESAVPKVIVNRFDQRLFASGIRRSDIDQTLGFSLAGTIPNDYGLVREAIDRGVSIDEIKSRNRITTELRRLLLNDPVIHKQPARSQKKQTHREPAGLAGSLFPVRMPAFMRRS